MTTSCNGGTTLLVKPLQHVFYFRKAQAMLDLISTWLQPRDWLTNKSFKVAMQNCS